MRPDRCLLILALALLASGCGAANRDRDTTVPVPDFTAAPPPPPLEQPVPHDGLDSPPLAGHAGLRFDCTEDAQCGIMDVGNCCGAYPACVNSESRPDPAAVARECAERGLAGICGFPVIESCACVANRCEARGPQAADAEGDGAAAPTVGEERR